MAAGAGGDYGLQHTQGEHYIYTCVCIKPVHICPRTHQVIERAMEVYVVMQREEWVVRWPGQAVLCVSQKYWTAYMHEAIRNGQQVHVHT